MAAAIKILKILEVKSHEKLGAVVLHTAVRRARRQR
jgi:hypothetical protein